MGAEIKLFTFVLVMAFLEVLLFAGQIPTASLSFLLDQPPQYQYVGSWDFTGIASAIWYGLSVLFWAISKPFLFIALIFEVMFFSGIQMLTIANSLLMGSALVVAIVMYIKGFI